MENSLNSEEMDHMPSKKVKCHKENNIEKAKAVPNLDKELHQNGMWNNRLHPVLEYGMRPREFLPSLQKQIWGQWKLRNRFREEWKLRNRFRTQMQSSISRTMGVSEEGRWCR